jgi:hypothetical protein
MNAGTRLTAAGAFSHLKTLDDVVADFVARYGDGGKSHDRVVAFAAKQTSLGSAIRVACAGRGEDGKMMSYQSRIKPRATATLTERLLENRKRLSDAADFDALHDVVHDLRPIGIAELTTYCVALRIGAYLRLEPRRHLYLHTGAAKGWRALTGDRTNPVRVLMEDVPAVLRPLGPHRLEDLMCEYQDVLRPEMIR